MNYLNTSFIRQFISERGKILSRRINKLTLKQQRFVTLAIKQARILSLLPFFYNYKKIYRFKSIHRPINLRIKKKNFN
uniref:Small ribosomal subunit protein bS18c n=1 Tax=Arachnitis uniflora TaxID=191246 RepID=A0A0K1H2G5_9LILI|nr:ribosomal protein S18 [Arachnitis uniflora]